jgi:hypothetical protein
MKKKNFLWQYWGFELRAGDLLDRCSTGNLSYASSPFCSGYFGDRILLFAQVVLNGDPLVLSFWDDRHVLLHPAIG